MPVLKFSVIGQDLHLAPFKEKIVANSVNYLEIEFSFERASLDWEGLNKFVEFVYNRKSKTIPLGDNLKFFVPEEVIKTPGFSVSVFGRRGGSDSEKKQITTEVIPIKVYPSGLLNGDDIEDDNNIHLSIAEEALEKSKEALTAAQHSTTKVNELGKRIDLLEDDISAALTVASDFNALEEKVSNSISIHGLVLRSHIETAETKFSQFEEDHKKLNTILQESIPNLSGNIDAINTKISNIEVGVANNTKRLEAVGISLADMQTDISNLQEYNEELTDYRDGLESQIDDFIEQHNFFNEELNNLSDRIGEISGENDGKLIEKEDTDFISYVNLNLITDYYEGDLNLQDGTIIEDANYCYSNYIQNFSTSFVANYPNFKVCFYAIEEIEPDDDIIDEGEDEPIEDEPIEDFSNVNYIFLSSMTVSENIFLNQEDADCFRIGIPSEYEYIFNIQEGEKYTDDSSYYEFDESLEEAINKLIDEKVGTIINADY
jgi:hypothetical protein